MATFQPTQAPPGRLVRLSVVLDTRNTPSRLCEIARMCDRAGVDALWIDDHLADASGSRLEAWTALVRAGAESSRARLGAMLMVALRPPAIVAAMAATLDVVSGGRVEIGFRASLTERQHVAFGLLFEDDVGRARRLEEHARIVRELLAGQAVDATGTYELHDARLSMRPRQPGGPPLSIGIAGPLQIAAAVRVADNAVLPAGTVEDVGAAIAEVRAACEGAARDPKSLGIAVEVPVSIGRTSAEAHARVRAEPLFREVGDPATVGIFGTLEQCQDRVIALAHRGVSELRCLLPNTPDVHDVIAQLTAAAPDFSP